MGGRKRKRLAVSTDSVSSIGEVMSTVENDKADEREDEEEFVKEQVQAGRMQFLLDLGDPSKLTGVVKAKEGKAPIPPSSSPLGRTKKLRRGVKRPRQTQGDESEEEEEEGEDYEAQPRLPEWTSKKSEAKEDEKKLHYRLPLKDRKGLIQQRPVVLEDFSGIPQEESPAVNEDKDDNEEVMEDGDPSSLGLPAVFSAAQLLVVKERKLRQRKELIADLASRLVEDPEENIELLKRLRLLCSERDPHVALIVRKLAMASLMTVFKDIVPSYSIRELTDVEKGVKVSKDVRKLRDFEQTLLTNYQHFLTLLDDTIRVGLAENMTHKKVKGITWLQDKQSISDKGMQRLAEVALQCQCELAQGLAHFNFRKNIFTVLVQRMNSPSLDGKVSRLCCDAVSRVFQNDIVGEVSLELLQLITKMLKSRGFNTKPEALRTFLHLQLHSAEGPTAGTKRDKKESKMTNKQRKKLEKQRMSKKERKQGKMRAQVDKELRETEAEENQQKKSRLQTDCIKLVFYVYFRILKTAQHSPLLGVVLEGLAKFAHLISVDYFGDLMSVLHSLMSTNSLSHTESMQCIITAFEILSGQGESLNIDPRQFFCRLYCNLLQLDFSATSDDIKLTLQSLDKMIRKRREVSCQRVLAFVKRLSTMSLQLPPGTALAVMAALRHFMQGYPLQCDQLLDTNEATHSAPFRPDVPDPELSGTQSTMLWELSTLSQHFDPCVSGYAKHLLVGAPSQGKGSLHPDYSRRSPEQLLDSFSWPAVDIFTKVPSSLPNKTKTKTLTSASLWVNRKFSAYVSKIERDCEAQANNIL